MCPSKYRHFIKDVILGSYIPVLYWFHIQLYYVIIFAKITCIAVLYSYLCRTFWIPCNLLLSQEFIWYNDKI